MSAQIRIDVQVMEYPSKNDIQIAFPLSEALIRKAFIPIDLPDESANGFVRELICTSSVQIAEVKINRKRMAEMLSEILTEKILEIMDSNDTVMGYEQEGR